MTSIRLLNYNLQSPIIKIFRKCSSIPQEIIHNNIINIIQKRSENLEIDRILKNCRVNLVRKNPFVHHFEWTLYLDNFSDLQRIYAEEHSNDKFRFSCLSKSNDLVSRTRLSSTKLIDEAGMNYHKNSFGLYEYYINDHNQLLSVLFKNGNDIHTSRVKFDYIKHGLIKRSPNILTIRANQEMDETELLKTLECYKIHRMERPQTAAGFWKIYVADRESYLSLIEEPIRCKNHMLEIYPYYGHSIQISQGSKLSDRYLFLYSKKSFDKKNLAQFFGLKDSAHISFVEYELGFLYTLNIPNSDDFRRIVFMNGLPIDDQTDYLMCYCDEPTIFNISKPSLILSVPTENLSGGTVKPIAENINLEVTTCGDFTHIAAKTKNMEEYLSVINSPINVGSHIYHFTPNFSNFLGQKYILETDITATMKEKLFDPDVFFKNIPIYKTCKAHKKLYIQFLKEHLEPAFFRTLYGVDIGTDFKRTSLSRFHSENGIYGVINLFKLKRPIHDLSVHNYIYCLDHMVPTSSFINEEGLPSEASYKSNIKELSDSYNLKTMQFYDDIEPDDIKPDYQELKNEITTLISSDISRLYYAKKILDKHNIKSLVVIQGDENTLQLFLKSLDELDIILSDAIWGNNFRNKSAFDISPGIDLLKI